MPIVSVSLLTPRGVAISGATLVASNLARSYQLEEAVYGSCYYGTPIYGDDGYSGYVAPGTYTVIATIAGRSPLRRTIIVRTSDIYIVMTIGGISVVPLIDPYREGGVVVSVTDRKLNVPERGSGTIIADD